MTRWWHLLLDRTTLTAFASGLLLAMAFPRPDLSVMAWCGLVPLFMVMHRAPFRAGLSAGTGFFGVVLYWLNIVMVTYGGLHPVVSVVLYLLLVAYLALYFGLATWAACRLLERNRLALPLTMPIVWVASEYLRSFVLTGFPWATLGYSQQGWLSMIQSADLFGVYGLSYLLVLVNVTLAETLRALTGVRQRSVPRYALLSSVLLVTANLGYGQWRLDQELDRRAKTLTTTVVQGNIDQSIKWSPSNQQATVDTYRDLSRGAQKNDQSELLIWPESATPFYYQDGGPLADTVRGVAREGKSFLLFGSPAFEKYDGRWHFLNSAFLLSPQGEILGRSDKIHLVPFGEYVPLGRFLPFINKLVEGIGDFSPGKIRPLPLNGSKIGVLVCYEAIFPELARDYVRFGSDLLVNVTNDAWYGHSSAPYQHLAMARFRAVENRIWLARAANTGISAFVAPSGRIEGATQIFTTVASTSTRLGLGANPTLYTRIGAAPAALCLLLTVGALLGSRHRRFR